MTQYGFSKETFEQSLARARAAEQKEISLAAAGVNKAQSQDLCDFFKQQAAKNLQRSFTL